MDIAGHFNTSNTELKLPALPNGYNWEVRALPDTGGVWLVLDLHKTVSYRSVIRLLKALFGFSLEKRVLVSSHRAAYYHTFDKSNHPTDEKVRAAFVDVAKQAYVAEFPESEKPTPQAHTRYVGVYGE